MDKFEILCLLRAISNYAYDIHYTAQGRFFYSDHIFSERLADVDVEDDLIETMYLGESQDAPSSTEINARVIDVTPEISEDTDTNFKRLREMIVSALMGIEQYNPKTRAEDDILGSIAHILQRHNGLLFRQLRYDTKENSNDEDIKEWITVRGNHIPVMKGQTKEEAVKGFIEKDKGEEEFSDNKKLSWIKKKNYQETKEKLEKNTGKTFTNSEVTKMVDSVASYSLDYIPIIAACSKFEGREKDYVEAVMDEADKKKAIEDMESIDKFLDNAPKYNGKAYRGLAFDILEGNDFGFEEFRQNYKKGNIVEFGAFSSWSKSESVAKQFSSMKAHNFDEEEDYLGSAQVKFVLENSSQGVEIENLCESPYQQEVLFKRNSKFRVKDYKEVRRDDEYDGTYDYYIEVMLEEANG